MVLLHDGPCYAPTRRSHPPLPCARISALTPTCSHKRAAKQCARIALASCLVHMQPPHCIIATLHCCQHHAGARFVFLFSRATGLLFNTPHTQMRASARTQPTNQPTTHPPNQPTNQHTYIHTDRQTDTDRHRQTQTDITIQYNTKQYNTIQHNNIPYHTIPYHTIPYHTYHYITLHCIALHCITLHYIT